jgi:RNA 2',3'-cyclic 3'-phosphodiesterase
MRLFLALDLPRDVKHALGEWIRRLIRTLGPHRSAQIKFVDAENLHLTLRFFGEVDPPGFESLVAALDRPWSVAPFELELGSTGTFPPRGRPRVVWIGATAGREASIALYDEARLRLQNAGFPDIDPRPFSPHATIGRVRDTARSGLGSDLTAALAATALPVLRCTIDRLTLFESHLSPRGPRYEVRERFGLQVGA